MKGGFDAWENEGKEIDSIESVDVGELATVEDALIVDVRRESEYKSEHIIGAINAPLNYINESSKKIVANQKHYVHCASGYRSLIFISILQSRGYRNLVDVMGGFKAIKDSGKFKISEYVCPTTML